MSENSPQILIIPIDNRPVCYDLPLQVAKIFKNAKIFVPDKSLLGGLNKVADTEKITGWIEHILKTYNIDIAIVSLDTIAYGGLISSRRTEAKFEEIKSNIDSFLNILNSCENKIKIYAVSSIMRISNNNCNEEEKSYWENYGTDLFRFSYLSHKLLRDYDVEIEAELISLAQKIPFEIVDDYLNTRKRNFDINSYYIDLLKKGTFEHIVFSQDDTAEYGFNVEEKELLEKLALKELISDKITIKTGADEMILSLLSRAFCEYYKETVLIQPIYFSEKVKEIVSLYEDVPIQKAINSTIELCGAKWSDNSDLKLLVNGPVKTQDELCLGIIKDIKDNTQADALIDFIKNNENRYMIADIKKANGADDYLLNKLLSEQKISDRFYGFAAWNTTGNTLGTVIAVGVIKNLAEKYSLYDEVAFKKVQYTRFLDDWAYQANIRRILREKGSTKSIVALMKKYEDIVSSYLDVKYETSYSFPWERTFEVEVII